MDRRRIEIEQFERAVSTLRREFPLLRIDVVSDILDLDARAIIPAQPGLDFTVGINLQNRDELHLTASNLWVEWFPCGQEKIFDEYLDALRGVLSGRFRIRESFVGSEAIKAQLQRPAGDNSWTTVATWSNLGCLIPWKRRRRIVQNRPHN